MRATLTTRGMVALGGKPGGIGWAGLHPAMLAHRTTLFENKMKTFYTQDNIGKTKYTVSFHDGVKTHSDRSPFFDIRLFRNKVKRDAFVKELRGAGYAEVGGAAFSKEETEFHNYCLDFYGPQGIYRMDATLLQVQKATATLYERFGKKSVAFDSVDRERVRDILIEDFGLVFPTK